MVTPLANYYEQCNCGAYCDEAPCERCRAEQLTCEPKAPAEPIIRLGHNKFPPMQCQLCGGKGMTMTKDCEVEMCAWCKGTGGKRS